MHHLKVSDLWLYILYKKKMFSIFTIQLSSAALCGSLHCLHSFRKVNTKPPHNGTMLHSEQYPSQLGIVKSVIRTESNPA